MSTAPRRVALAMGAHPDDIEFQMAGTLLLLRQAGFETHYFNVAHGNCGGVSADTRRIRAGEARGAARILGARFHPSLVGDLEILYEPRLLRRVASVIRGIKPSIVLTHPPRDYMEDHTNTCRLAVTACFARGMPNFRVTPPRTAWEGDVALYHCMPHGLRDELRGRAVPDAYVDTSGVYDTKFAALGAHKSQQTWLHASQGMNSYLLEMKKMSLELGRMSGKFTHAEGWRRHLHIGFSGTDDDPLARILGGNYLLNKSAVSG